MPFVVASSPTSTSSEEEIVKAALQRQTQTQTTGNGYIQLPSSSQILERLYNDHGVRVRMIRRNRPKKIPTVRELIDHLSKKHERLLEIQAKGSKIEKNTVKDGRMVSLESLDSETPRNSLKKKPAKADDLLTESIASKDNIRKQPWKSDSETVDFDSTRKRKPVNLFVGTDKRTEGCETPGDVNRSKAKKFEDVLSDGVTIPHRQTLDLFIGPNKRAEDVVEPRWKLDPSRDDENTERNDSKDNISW